jgi:hypothetical protein
VRIVAAAVLAAAADAVQVAHHIPKLGAHLSNAARVVALGDVRGCKVGDAKAAAAHQKKAAANSDPTEVYCVVPRRWLWWQGRRRSLTILSKK